MTTETANNTNTAKSNNKFGRLVLGRQSFIFAAVGSILVGLAIYAALAHWQASLDATYQEQKLAYASATRQRHELLRKRAVQQEYETASKGFATESCISWKLDYDRAKGMNYLNIEVRNPLQYHEASFSVRFEGKTHYAVRDGWLGERQWFSKDVNVPAMTPGSVLKMHVYWSTPVSLHPASTPVQALEWLGLNQVMVTEPPIDTNSVSMVFYQEKIKQAL